MPLAPFLLEKIVAPSLESGEAALDATGRAAVEPDRGLGQGLQKAPVVADEDERGAQAFQLALQPFDGGQVEMVGRLVEEQDVGRGRKQPRQRRAPRLAARQARRVLFAGEAQFVQEVTRAVGIIPRPEPRLDVGERGRESLQVRLLRQVADGRAGLDEAAAAIGFDQPGGDFQERRLAGAVASDKAGAFARSDDEFGVLQERGAPERQPDVLQREERRSHA